MKKLLALLLVLLSLLALTACTDGPLVVTATPAPTPTPTPAPTTESIYQEYVFLPPDEGLGALLPEFPCMLEVLMETGDESLFAVFEEYNSSIIDDYIHDLKDAGFTVIEEESDMFFSASMEGTDGLLRVSLMYEGGYGTLQVYDDRED